MKQIISTAAKCEKYSVSLNIQKIVVFALFICFAAILKLFYSHATPVELLWILKPTTLSVGFITGISFEFNILEGYCSNDNRVIIAPACAGVNFMIILICLTATLVCKYKQIRYIRQFVLCLVAIIAVSYSVTLLFNSIRIVIAIAFYDAGIHWEYFSQERIHRLIGIIVYFAGISVVYLLTERFLNQSEKFPKSNLNKYTKNLIPLIWYITIMIVIPLLQGKQMCRYQLFLEHMLFTAGVPVLILLIIVVSKKIVNERKITI
jgi:exosortase K